MKLYFNGVDLSTFLKVTSANRGIIPNRVNKTYSVPKRAGSIYNGYTYDEKVIMVDFVIVNDDLNAVRRAMAGILDVDEPKNLVFDDEPDYYWLAVPDGEVNLDETLRVGKGTIKFLCPRPYAFKSTESEFILTSGQRKMTVMNNGSAPTNPKIEVTFGSDCGFVGVASPNGVVQVGNKISLDTTTVIPNSEKLIETTFSGTSKNTWSLNTVSPLHVNAQASGTLAEDTNGVRTDSFGTWIDSKKWHGPVFKKALAADSFGVSTADNWELFSYFHFRTLDDNAVRSLGMMEFGVLDSAGTKIAVMRLGDVLDIEALAGSLLYVGANLDQNGVEQPQAWDDGGYDYFNGTIRITKMGNNFTFEIYNITNGKTLNKTFYNETIGALKAQSAYIFMGRFKDTAVYNDMSVTYFRFTKHHTEIMVDIPNIFSNGDKLVIDNEEGEVFLNGAPYLDTLDIGSNFFPIKQGSTELGFVFSSWLTVEPTVKVVFKERYY